MSNYPLFSVIGIEIEYMIVDKATLNVAPVSDQILQALAGETVNEVDLGDIAVSNELVLHVIELKNAKPASPDAPLVAQFQETLQTLTPILAAKNLQLIPSSAHPWMDPLKETERWPHGNKEIYQQFDEIFGCSGHGWSNLQTMHINLPFANDEEFKFLHNAIRLLLPLLPALAASSPFLDGKASGMLDTRLDFYGKNQQKIPSIGGQVIPEFINSEAEYQEKILQPMYQAISPYDPRGILQYEWLNSRAAIPKFKYRAIEIRILDTQECATADIAIAKLVFAILKKWHDHAEYFLNKPYETQGLKHLYDQTRKSGLSVLIDDPALRQQWQLQTAAKTCRDVWHELITKVSSDLDFASQKALETILHHGNLSERLLKACKQDYRKTTLEHVYRQLGHCLLTNKEFLA